MEVTFDILLIKGIEFRGKDEAFNAEFSDWYQILQFTSHYEFYFYTFHEQCVLNQWSCRII